MGAQTVLSMHTLNTVTPNTTQPPFPTILASIPLNRKRTLVSSGSCERMSAEARKMLSRAAQLFDTCTQAWC
jgi:hypothetical protein